MWLYKSDLNNCEGCMITNKYGGWFLMPWKTPGVKLPFANDKWSVKLCHMSLVAALPSGLLLKEGSFESSNDGERPIRAWLLRLTPTTKRLPGKGIAGRCLGKSGSQHGPQEQRSICLRSPNHWHCPGHRFYLNPQIWLRERLKVLFLGPDHQAASV